MAASDRNARRRGAEVPSIDSALLGRNFRIFDEIRPRVKLLRMQQRIQLFFMGHESGSNQ